MNLAAAICLGLLFSAWMAYLYARSCLLLARAPGWLMALLAMVELGVAALGFASGGLLLFGWRLLELMLLIRYEPLAGVFVRCPRWPRHHMPGPGGRARREFREPLPWTRGPFSY